MSSQPPSHRLRPRLSGLAATLAVHLALLLCWQMTREAPAPPGTTERIQWVNVAQPTGQHREVKTREEPPPAPPPAEHRRSARLTAKPAREQARPSAAPPPMHIATPADTPLEGVAGQPSGKSGYDILQQARKDLGKISKELGKEFPGQKIKAPRNTAQTRLEKGIALAHELAPPKWYEAPKIKEIIDPGQYGRKRYRITTALGTYCMTYESNHAPDGIDVITKGMQQKRTNCPKDELPPTEQEGL